MLLDHLIFFASLIGIAAAFARLEIEIEGGAGWASALPTWRIDNRWTRRLLGGRALTGYHLCAHLFLLLVGHLPYAMAFVRPSLAAEARIASFLVLFWILEDFLWFVYNPAFGIRRFRREHIPWHAASWWWIMPREYWLLPPVALALYAWSW
ncbi:MAG TPA: hypothetical protein VF212_02970 [Longimicrobiales bacterium]